MKDDRLLDAFSIVVNPRLDAEYKWTGELELSIHTQTGNILDDEDYDALMNFTRLICASVPLMERRADIRRILTEEAEKHMPENLLNKKEGLKVVDKKDNVITLDFATKTKGEA